MTTESVHLAQRVARPASEVYAYAADPAHLSDWAPGLGSSAEHVDGALIVETPAGPVRVEFAARNEFGVLDHDVIGPDGAATHNPLRVLPWGEEASEVVFTLRRAPGTSDEDFARDRGLVAADLARLAAILES